MLYDAANKQSYFAPMTDGAYTPYEIKAIVDESMKFLASLEFTLREGLPQEQLVAPRQCIDRVSINRPDNQMKIRFRIIPSASLAKSVVISQNIDAH